MPLADVGHRTKVGHLGMDPVPKTQRHGSCLPPPLLQLPVLMSVDRPRTLILPHSALKQSAPDCAATISGAALYETANASVLS